MKTFEEYREQIGEVGYIQSVIHSIVYVSGLPGAKPKELVIGEGGQRGVVQSLSNDLVEVLMFDTHNLRNNLAVARTNEAFKIAVSPAVLGRVINPFGQSIDESGPIIGEKVYLSIDPPAPGISKRAKIDRSLESGVAIVDLLIPLGYGQRELVIGDKKTGKTTFILQTMASQAKKGVVCIYVSIGKRAVDVKVVEDYLKGAGVMENCCIVVASSSDPATLIYLAPYAGMAIAEFFRDMKRDVLIAFDDLTNHAKFYRELTLLAKRTPGRGSYPGDIFHLHAALLERAGNIRLPSGEIVSITCLPVAETLEGDLTGYIQTNLMAITDGHIFFDVEEFRKGERPAINYSLSVSRVGNQTKGSLERRLAQSLRESLIRYQKDLDIAKFGVELPEQTRREIDFGEKIKLLFNQDSDTLIPRNLQLLLFGLLLSGFWDGKNTSLVKVDLIKMVQIYTKGYLNDLLKYIAAAQNIEELTAIAKKYSPKITEILYV